MFCREPGRGKGSKDAETRGHGDTLKRRKGKWAKRGKVAREKKDEGIAKKRRRNGCGNGDKARERAKRRCGKCGTRKRGETEKNA
jgi:hypothetical protein